MTEQTERHAELPSQVDCVSEDLSVEKLEVVLPAGTNLRPSYHQLHGGPRNRDEKRGSDQCSTLRGQSTL